MSIDTVTWNALFAVINLIQSSMLLHAERPINLHPTEEEIYIHIFRSRKIPLSRRDFRTLAKKAMILDYADGESYLQQGDKVETVALVMSGHIDVYTTFQGDQRFAKLNVTNPWEWVDSPQFLQSINAGDNPPKVAVSLIASGPTQLCVWTLDDIRQLCAANQQLMVCLLSVIAHDCATKITRTEEYLLSSESVRSAAASLLQESDLRRRADSLEKLPITAKQRMIGVDHTSIDMGDSPATGAAILHTKSARRLASQSPTLSPNTSGSVYPDPYPANSPAEKKSKKKRNKQKQYLSTNETELDTVAQRATSPDADNSGFSRALDNEDPASTPADDAPAKKQSKKKGRMLHNDEPAELHTSLKLGSPVIEDDEEVEVPKKQKKAEEETESSTSSSSSSLSSSSLVSSESS